MNASFEKSVKLFKEKQQEFANENYGKFVVIFDGEVKGFYDNQLEAYKLAKAQFLNEQFLLQQCVYPEEETKVIFHSRVG